MEAIYNDSDLQDLREMIEEKELCKKDYSTLAAT